MSNTIHAYISQSDKGELVIGAGTDVYTSYTQRGGLHIAQHTLEAICEIFPQFRRIRMLRNWGGHVDVTPDRRSEEHTSEIQSLLRTSYAVICLKKKTRSRHIIRSQQK